MSGREDDDTTFPIDVKCKTINFLQTVLLFGIKFLALLMVITILWSIVDVAYTIYQKAMNEPILLMNVDELLSIFGAFLIVLIAIEIFLNIILYLRKDMGHLKLVVATALMAISRKIIILDYDHSNAMQLISMGVIIAALGLAYWLIVKSHPKCAEKSGQ